MSERDRARILERIRAALPPVAARRSLPVYDDAAALSRRAAAERARGGDRVSSFRAQMEAAHGRCFTDPAALAAWLLERGAARGYCDPVLRAALGPALSAGFTLDWHFDPARIDEYAFGITRAAGAIAETGTVILDDATTSSRLGALAPWIHVAVVAPRAIHGSIADAIAVLGDDPNVIWCTGPSKTADVEGILIEGVHGPGEQVALLLEPP